MYVAADADLPRAVDGAVRACFSSAGQLCISVERLLVHEDVADEFVAAFVRATRGLRLGAGLRYDADMGSLCSAAQLARVTAPRRGRPREGRRGADRGPAPPRPRAAGSTSRPSSPA